MQFLIKNGADVDIRDFSDWTPLHYAVIREKKEIAEMLVNVGANVNLRASEGRNALYMAAAKGNKDIVEILIIKEPMLIWYTMKNTLRYTKQVRVVMKT